MFESSRKTEKTKSVTVESLKVPVERKKTAELVLNRVKKAFIVLGIPYPKLPEIVVDFRVSDDKKIALLGQTEVKSDDIAIPFDRRLLNREKEKSIVRKMHENGNDYPGVGQALVHEIGHISMWSVAGHDRVSSSTRLLDEGWAALIERAGALKQGSVEDLMTQAKNDVREIIKKDPETYEMFLNLSHTPASGEQVPGSNASEYAIGPAFLLWIYQIKGKEAMTELLRQTPSAGLMGPVTEPHPDFQKYISVNQKEATPNTAREWELDRLWKTLLNITGLSSLEEVERKFRKWALEF